ncbi:MAG: ferric reductase, partial [Thiomonas sp.]
MRAIKIIFPALLLLLTALWLLADTLVPQPFGYFAFRNVFMQYSGIIAIGAMSVAMMLAARPKWLEPRLRGL